MDGQSGVTKAPRSSRPRQERRQRTPGERVSQRRSGARGRAGTGASDQLLHPEQDAPVSPLVLPAPAGLSLPRLAGIPTSYPVHTDVGEGARLALSLLEARIIEADDFVKGHDPASFIARSLERLWVPRGIKRFSLDYSLVTAFDQLYFLITLSRGDTFDFSQPALVCDRVHEALGPSLLSQLDAATPLLPAFTPEACRAHIEMTYWEGWEDAAYLFERARSDLAYARRVTEESLSQEEVETYADQHYFTPNTVNELLEPRYQQPGRLSLEQCGDLCRSHGYPNLTRVCELLGELRTLARALPERSESLYGQIEHYQAYGVVIGLPSGQSRDLVEEIYWDYERDVWNGGEFGPVYALELGEDPETLVRLKRALRICQRSLELTEALYDTLEVTSSLSP